MRKYFIKDFEDQKKNITALLMLTVIGAVIGYGFQSIYSCVGILLTAGTCIIYFGSFSDYVKVGENKKESRTTKILRRKLCVRIKYLEIIVSVVPLYLLMSAAYTMDAFDRNLFTDPEFTVLANLEQIALFPLIFVLSTSLATPMLLNKKINKTGFIGLALLSIILPYCIFLLNFFTSFTEKKLIMAVLPFPILGVAIIFYLISMALAIRGK